MEQQPQANRMKWLAFSLLGLALVLFTILWPQRWEYHKQGNVHFRTNKWTSRVEMFTFSEWEPVNPPRAPSPSNGTGVRNIPPPEKASDDGFTYIPAKATNGIPPDIDQFVVPNHSAPKQSAGRKGDSARPK